MFCDICNTEQADGIYVETTAPGTPAGFPGSRYLRVCWGCLTVENLALLAKGRELAPLARAS